MTNQDYNELLNMNIQKQIGRVIMSKQLIETLDFKELRAFFSNFFPIQTTIDSVCMPYDKIIYIGYSPHFREIIEGEGIPTYDFVFGRSEDEVFIDAVHEIKNYY